MNAERNAKLTPTPKAGIFATLSNPLRVRGSGAPSIRSAALCGALTIAFALFALAPSAASAKQARLFAGSFGAASNPAPFPANPYPLGSAESVAVDKATGDIYVADHGNARVEKFDSAGNFILTFGRNVNKTKVEEAGSAQAERDLCTLASGDVCQVGEPLIAEERGDPLESPHSVAVDNSSGPSKGDVYVANGRGGNEEIAVGLIDKFDSSGNLIETWGDSVPAHNGQLQGSAVPEGPFAEIRTGGIAVDPAGNLWVSEFHKRLSEFSQDGIFAQSFAVGTAGQLGIDSEDNFYLYTGEAVVKFNSEGKLTGQVAPSKTEAQDSSLHHTVDALGVDPSTDELYVAGRQGAVFAEEGILKRYDSSCHPTFSIENPQLGCVPAEEFGAGLIANPFRASALAVDPSSHAIYVAEAIKVAVFSIATVPDVVTTKPTNPTQTSATLTGTINPGGVELNAGLEGCRFEYVEAALYEPAAANPYAAGQTKACNKTEAEIGKGNAAVEVQAPITGLEAGKTYHYRLLASNINDSNGSIDEPSLGQDLAFGPPLVEGASIREATSTTATLRTEVNPNDLDTQVRIEYGTQPGVYDQFTSKIDIGSAGKLQFNDLELSGLSPATTYHYRVVAESVLGEGPEAALGPEQTLVTQSTGSFSLPDSREWEMVSPPSKLGAQLEPLSESGIIEAAPDGHAIAYLANLPTVSEPEGYAGTVDLLSSRGATSWSTRDISVPHLAATGGNAGTSTPEYKSFSSDLSTAVIQQGGPFNPDLSPEASESTPYLHQLTNPCAGSCYRPLVTAKPGFANVPEGTQFGEDTKCEPQTKGPQLFCGPEYAGASEDGSHVFFNTASSLELTPGEPGGLYQWFGGQLERVSILPDGLPVVDAFLGGVRSGTIRRAISSNASRVFWSYVPAGHESLYLRDMARAESVQLDAPEAGCVSCEAGGGQFQIASSDGSRAFFTDTRRLTADSGASDASGGKRADLYECRIEVDQEGKLACSLTDLTPAGGGEIADVQGSVLGASADGSSLYFVAKGDLDGPGPATHTECSAENTFCNLYRVDDGVLHFVTLLATGDGNDWSGITLFQSTRLSPDGRWLELMSRRPLTGYDNRDAATGRPVAEVYLYDAEADRFLCASCVPSGARPHGVEYRKIESGNGGLVGSIGVVPQDALVGANVPSWTSQGHSVGGYQPRALSASGRLFFNTVNALVPQDSNANQDVYQYEPPGVGGCTEQSRSFAPTNGGCIDLISAGTSGEESGFIDASESGDDVFFLTASQLVPQDEDAALDLYDAHVCSTASPCLPSPPPPAPACEGDACQQPAVPPNDPTPSSLTFQGAGNQREVRSKKKHRTRHRRKHHKKGPAKRTTNQSRRTSR